MKPKQHIIEEKCHYLDSNAEMTRKNGKDELQLTSLENSNSTGDETLRWKDLSHHREQYVSFTLSHSETLTKLKVGLNF